MSLRHWCARLSALVCAASALTMSAGPIGASGPPAAAGMAVRGVVWNSDNTPVPGIKVRLRNVQLGRLDGNTVSDDSGHFVFSNVRTGVYAAEVVGSDGKVIAVGQSFRVETGETVGTFVRLAPRQPWFAGVLSNTAATVISAASSAGVTAIGSHAPPISPQ